MLQREVHFLAHVVMDNDLKMDPAKIEAVATWPEPQNLKEVRSFVGLCAWYREFVPHFATLTAPLYSFTRKGQRFLWSTECNRSFLELRDRLVSAPVLALPIDDGRFILDVDASDLSVSAVLSQLQGGKERVIAYFSHRHAATEMNYCTTCKELLAVVKHFRMFRVYLVGRPFLLRTDHGALRWLRLTRRISVNRDAGWWKSKSSISRLNIAPLKNTAMPTPFLADPVGSVFSARKTWAVRRTTGNTRCGPAVRDVSARSRLSRALSASGSAGC